MLSEVPKMLPLFFERSSKELLSSGHVYFRSIKLFLFLLLFFSKPLQATYQFKEGRFIHEDYLATQSVQEHFSAASEAFEKQQWDVLLRQALIIRENYPSSHFLKEAIFFLGTAHYQLGNEELANKYLSSYLKSEVTSKHFEEAIIMKFEIAQRYMEGKKKHLFGAASLPRWMPAYEDALKIYEEVIAALPNHDLGAKALFGKGQLLLKEELYVESMEAFQTVIRRFPKQALAIESYLEIGKVYLARCKKEYPDPDLLQLANINMQKFQKSFPSDERASLLKNMIGEMEEIYAKSLYETGRFFERTKKPQAALIYYKKVMMKYPETHIARQAAVQREQIEQKLPSLKNSRVEFQSQVEDQLSSAAEKVKGLSE